MGLAGNWGEMKFKRMPKGRVIGINNRRLAAARRYLQREKDKFPLLPEFQPTETPEERIERLDKNFLRWCKGSRNKTALSWKKIRKIIRNRTDKNEIISFWNRGIYPFTTEYLSDLVNNIEKEPNFIKHREVEIEQARRTGELMREILSAEKIDETVDYKTAFFDRLTKAKKRFDEIASTERSEANRYPKAHPPIELGC